MKRFGKTLLICFAVIAILATLLTGCSHKIGNELLVNGNFESMNQDTKTLENWNFVYVNKDGSKNSEKSFQAEKPLVGSNEAEFGDRYISITTEDYATAYLKTSVKLYSGQKYLLSVTFNVKKKITTESGDNDAIGGYFGFLEDKNFQEINAYDSNGWVTRNIYFKPTSTAKYTFVAGIGREDLGGGSGTIAFDNISIKAVKDVPVGTNTAKLTPGSSVSDKEVGGIVYTVLLCLFGTALVIGAYYVIRILQKKSNYIDSAPLFDDDNDGIVKDDNKNVTDVKVKKSFKEFFELDNLKTTFLSPIALFVYTLVGAFLIRFILVMTVFGMGDTMTEYAGIALDIAKEGPSKLYGVHSNSLPTGYLYVLSLFGLIGNALDFTEKSIGMSMLIRIPNIIADLAVCYMIYKMIASNYNHKYSAVIAGVYALLPAAFTASVSWGLNMSISIAFLVAAINFMIEKKHVFVPIMYTLALMFSNAMLIALPVIIGYEIFFCVKDKKAILPIVIASVASFIVFYCLFIPFATEYFAPNSKPSGVFLVFSKMLENIKANNLISNSSFNFYAIFGLGNNASTAAMIILIALVMILFVIFGVYLFSKTRNRLDYILLLAMSFILWSVFGVGSRVEFTLVGVVLLLLYAGLKMERRVFRVFGILSVTNFVNTAVILTKSGAINFAFLDGTGLSHLYKLDPLYIIGSLITVGTVIYLLWVMYDIMANGVEKEIKPMPDNLLLEFKEDFDYNKNRVIKLLQRKK